MRSGGLRPGRMALVQWRCVALTLSLTIAKQTGSLQYPEKGHSACSFRTRFNNLNRGGKKEMRIAPAFSFSSKYIVTRSTVMNSGPSFLLLEQIRRDPVDRDELRVLEVFGGCPNCLGSPQPLELAPICEGAPLPFPVPPPAACCRCPGCRLLAAVIFAFTPREEHAGSQAGDLLLPPLLERLHGFDE